MRNYACMSDEDLADALVDMSLLDGVRGNEEAVALISVCAERIRNKTNAQISPLDAQISVAILDRICTAARKANDEAEKLKRKLVELDNMSPLVKIRIEAPKPGCRSHS